MKFLNRIFSKKRDTSDATSGAARRGVHVLTSPAGRALDVAAVYRCVQLLSDSVAALAMRPERREGGRFVEDTASPLHYLLSVQPQPELSIFDFWAGAVRLMLIDGNAYIYPRRVRGRVTDLVLCSRFSVSHDAVNGVYSVSDSLGGVFGTFPEAEIIHLYLHSTDGRRGESVLSYARHAIDAALAGDAETQNRFCNGGNVRGLVSNDKSTTGFGEYQDEELERTAESIDERFSRGEKIVSLPGQVEFRPISLSSTDMQFLETRRFTVKEICRFFGVHPSFVGEDGGGNYKSSGQAWQSFLTLTLNPLLQRIEAEFNRKLIARRDYGDRRFRFDRRGIYQLDLPALADYQLKTIEAGLYTVNEWRALQNQPPVAGGDVPFVSTNLQRLDNQTNPTNQTNQTNQTNKTNQ